MRAREVIAMIASVPWLVLACAAEDQSSGRARTTVTNDGTVQFEGGDTGKECTPQNVTQRCMCDALAGRQVCSAAGTWGPCECLDVTATPGGAGTGGGQLAPGTASTIDPPANKLAASFEWLRTPIGTPPSDCLPGHYEGGFDGGYQSPAAWNAPVPVVGLDSTGQPGVRFDLGSDGNGEFLTVTGGAMEGMADGLFPFRAEISDGQLDCASGVFEARLVNGSYDVWFLGFVGYFEGDLIAKYDPATRSFVGGVWAVMENGEPTPAIAIGQPPPVITPGLSGGSGMWTATWVR